MTKKPSVTQYISDKRAEGLNDSEITHKLLDAGWHIDVIHKVMHGEPIRTRDLKPILDIKKQRLNRKNLVIIGVILFIALCVAAAFI